MVKDKKNVPTVVIERSIRVVMRVPFDEDHYPDMTSIQAIDYELQQPRNEKINTFVDFIELSEGHELELTETIRLEQ